MLKVWTDINIIRSFFHIILFLLSPERAVIEKDLNRWIHAEQSHHPMWWKFHWALLWFPEFRSVFYYRLKSYCLVIAKLLEWLYPPRECLYIYTSSIGPGLFIEHGFSTIISAERIGDNCWINQQVTIGYSNETDCPVIGDNVKIFAGAKVIGKVKIGDNSSVGANAVVVKDVPPNCTVVGVPARIVRRDGKSVNEELR